jgi:hypothetical protein
MEWTCAEVILTLNFLAWIVGILALLNLFSSLNNSKNQRVLGGRVMGRINNECKRWFPHDRYPASPLAG